MPAVAQTQVAQQALAALQRQGAVLSGITADSRRVASGQAFAAYAGMRLHGRDFVPQAIAAGAPAVLWDEDEGRPEGLPEGMPGVGVPALKQHISALADLLYGQPSRMLRIIGVTGTNGKTSCTHWIAQAMTGLGQKTAVMGTLGNGIPPALTYTGNTTADAAELQRQLAEFVAQGASFVAMEASSEGLDQGRVNAVRFDTAVLTNLTRDHLDYHGDMEHYAAAKARLFAWPDLRAAVLNADDAFGRRLLAEEVVSAREVVTYGLVHGDVRGTSLQTGTGGLSMRVETPWGKGQLQASVVGRFNAENLLACLSVLLMNGVELDAALLALSAVVPPPGRMQMAGGGKQPLVLVDYAHTPDALEKVLTTLRQSGLAGRLFCVFGCGGNRDAGKRPLMGEIAARLADQVVVTSDNPRHEDPLQIVAEIRAGMSMAAEWVETDRARAIARAIAAAEPGDIVLIAGKGHENWQEVAGQRYPFDDLQVATAALEGRT